MEHARTIVVGAGMSGLAAAAALGKGHDTRVFEADREIGGYCKTVKQDGFVWDYSGHFFHFKHPEIEAWLRERMPGQEIRTIEKRSFISHSGGARRIDFPFQKNIHQLPKEELIDCLVDLYFARAPRELLGPDAPPAPAEESFKDMLYARFGRSIAEKFLIPYNEKLYACDLGRLDKDAMGRFFPHADLTAIVRNMRAPDNSSYNATFTYPEGGAIEYVRAVASEVAPSALALSEPVTRIDLDAKVVTTPRRQVSFDRLISSAPLNRLAALTGIEHDASVFSWNKVLVWNLGFDRKGPDDVHWMYYPDRATSFYRIGFYDNIFGADRMSLYVELGYPADAKVDAEGMRARVLADLEREGIVAGHELVSSHSVVMDPAYVHITRESIAETDRLRAELGKRHVHSIGRYGGWTYCSIEDNIVEARALCAELGA
ncbi:MAG: FAD-dependent oxidoreductase [Myxococcales bacterium]|nr:FAD-dependent oxidoreductase [Myxococcales bacterium]MBL0198381.1 FAD-dependent oxidoreductase [Myxococcales bacterium]HQY60093.1 FAD-dependent oxidoreductase [Polyangiaceae bacterium]